MGNKTCHKNELNIQKMVTMWSVSLIPSKGIFRPAALQVKAQSRTTGRLRANLIIPHSLMETTESSKMC